MKNSDLSTKSYDFANTIVKFCYYLINEKKEWILSKQLLRSGTSVGACIREAQFAESSKDFIHKLSISRKEINETIYWLELLKDNFFITNKEFEKLNLNAIEIRKILTSSIKTLKEKFNQENTDSL
jgi:four helix bundle protein